MVNSIKYHCRGKTFLNNFIVVAITFFILMPLSRAQVQNVKSRSNDNIVIKEIIIDGTTDQKREKLSPFNFARQLSTNSIYEGLWQGNHDVQIRVTDQNTIDIFTITFYNLGTCSGVRVTMYNRTINGDNFTIDISSPGSSEILITGIFNSTGDSVSGTYNYTNYSCGGSTSGEWYAIPVRSQNAYNIIWDEKFQDTSPPAGWTVVDNDNSGEYFSFYQDLSLSKGHVYPQSGNSFWGSGWQSANNDGLIDEWLISPLLSNITDNTVLILWAGAVGGNYADSLRIWISDSDNNLSSFDDLIAYFKVDGPLPTWHEYVFDISKYAGKQIYVAANYYIVSGGSTGANSDFLWIDHFCIAEPVVVSVENQTELPKDFELSQNYPNPFNPSTIIRYSIPLESKVTIKVYNLLGQEIQLLVNATESAGYHEVNFNATNLASGVYLYRITAASTDGKKEFVATKKLILMK